MATTKYLGKDELQYLLAQLKTKILAESKDELITSDAPSAQSTNDNAPGSLAVYNALQEVELKYAKVTGPISAVTPVKNTLYLQKDDANDDTYSLYVYTGTEWIEVIGGTGGDGSLSESDLEAITTGEIDDILDIV